MTSDNLIKFAELMGFKKIKETSGWVMCSCPFAPAGYHKGGTDNSPSFGMSVQSPSRYHCFSCHNKGLLSLLPQKLHHLNLLDDPSKARLFLFQHEDFSSVYDPDNTNALFDIAPVPEHFAKLFRHPIPDFFLKQRGLSKETIDRYNLGYDKFSMRVVIPVYHPKGYIAGYRGRDATGHKKVKYKSYTDYHPDNKDPKAAGVWYLMHEKLPEKAPLILVEGEFDALLLKQTGIVKHVWASMGSSLSNLQVKALQSLSNPLIFFFDDDDAGRLAVRKVTKQLKGLMPVYVVKDYAGMNDPAQIAKNKRLKKVLKSIERVV